MRSILYTDRRTLWIPRFDGKLFGRAPMCSLDLLQYTKCLYCSSVFSLTFFCVLFSIFSLTNLFISLSYLLLPTPLNLHSQPNLNQVPGGLRPPQLPTLPLFSHDYLHFPNSTCASSSTMASATNFNDPSSTPLPPSPATFMKPSTPTSPTQTPVNDQDLQSAAEALFAYKLSANQPSLPTTNSFALLSELEDNDSMDCSSASLKRKNVTVLELVNNFQHPLTEIPPQIPKKSARHRKNANKNKINTKKLDNSSASPSPATVITHSGTSTTDKSLSSDTSPTLL